MAGNNSIQFLRGSGHSSTSQLLPGQPYYDYTNNLLFIGGSVNTPINQAKAIGTSEVSTPEYLKKIQIKITKGTTVYADVVIAEIVTTNDWGTSGRWAMQCGGVLYPQYFENSWLNDVNDVLPKGSSFPILGVFSGSSSYIIKIAYIDNGTIKTTNMLAQTQHTYKVDETILS